MAKQFQSLQHMRTGPLGGVEALNDDEDRLRQHNEQLFKTLTDDEIQMERLELQETVRKLKEQRKFLSSTKSRPAWGSGNVTDASLRRSTGRPRSSQGRKSQRQTTAPQSHVPQSGIELHNTLGATRTSQPAATMSRADRDHIRALEDKIAALSATVTELRTSQHLTKVAPVPVEEAIPADYKDKVEALAQQHRENVATLRKVYEEKKASDKKIKVLERKLAMKEAPEPEPEAAATKKPKRKVKKKKKPKFTAAAVADSPPARNPAISKKGRARVEATPTGDSPAGFTAEREEGKLTDSKGSDDEGDDEHESGKAGADVDVDVEYDMDDDAGSEGGDFALPTDFDDEDEGGDFSKPGDDDDALGESLLHGVGVAGAPLSSATAAAAVKPRSRAKAARAKASKWALAATYGTEPADDVEFVQATRERYLDGAGGGSSSKLSEDGDSQSSSGGGRRRPKSARSKGSTSTVPRPFFGMVSREDLHGAKLGISARKRKEEEEERKKQEAVLLKWSFTARDPPKSSMEPRYERILKENAARREMNVKARREELESSTAPFKGVLERQEAAAEKWKATKAKILEERKAKEGETRTVKANPIPKWLRKGSLKAQMEAEEKLRKERIARHAAKSRAASKLPKRMAKYAEEKAKAEAEAKRKGKKKGKRRKTKGVPKVNTKVPDFATMQNDWKRKLESAKKQKKRKPVVPFSFDSEERLKAEAARRKKFQDKMEAEEASKHTPWSETFKKNRAAAVTARHAEPVNSKMTRAAEMRAKKTKELLQKRAQEAMEKRLAEQERKARVRSATKSLSSVVKAMENKRRGGRKLAWEKSSEKLLKEKMRTARENSDAKTAVSAASSRRRKRAEDKRLANRPLLFTRSSIEADSDKAYARALLRVEKNAKPAAEPESKGDDGDGDDFDEDADFLN